MNSANPFFETLRALGPINATQVPDVVARQVVSSGMFGGNLEQCKKTLALYAQVASKSTRAEFETILATGMFPGAIKLTDDEVALAAAGRSCCGHTCEGTCTPGSTR